jgi:hypothetical protein
MSVPQDPTHSKAFEGDDVEGHMALRRITEADAEVEQPDDDVEGHGRSSG